MSTVSESLPCVFIFTLLPSEKAAFMWLPVGPETQHANHNTPFCEGRFNYPVQHIPLPSVLRNESIAVLVKTGKTWKRFYAYNKFSTPRNLLPKNEILSLVAMHVMTEKGTEPKKLRKVFRAWLIIQLGWGRGYKQPKLTISSARSTLSYSEKTRADQIVELFYFLFLAQNNN